MTEAWQEKLRRLGVVKGARSLKPTRPVQPAQDRSPRPIPQSPPANPQPVMPGGRLEETAVGPCFVVDKVYPLHHRHGTKLLAALLDRSPAAAVPFCGEPRFDQCHFRDFLFIDTETTGLAGAGTLAFMVGTAFFEDDAFVVRQYFLRDHGDEPAMLLLLDELLAEKAGLITFNGRSFDLPLLDRRYLMNRMESDLMQQPHLDLLLPARRLWRQRLGSCALSALEPNLLRVERTQADVPGWLIPSLYHQYLLSGETDEMERVFYHNHIDMLSMVTLATQVMAYLEQSAPDLHPVDLVSLGKWQADLGLTETAESTLRQAAAADLPLELYHQSLHRLALLLKRANRRDEAVPLWQQIAATSYDDISAHVELAKHYEWQEQDLAQAQRWTQAALDLTTRWPPAQARLAKEELLHRLDRIQRKIENRGT
jgi:uncharacterized protein